jgi:fatty-acyl-CoA synthase
MEGSARQTDVPLSYPAMLARQAGLRPLAPAILTDSRRLSFAELETEARAIAGALAAHGIGRGDRVGILIGNRPEWLVLTFGIGMAGAVAVPFSTWSTRDELRFLLDDAAIRMTFVDATFKGRDFVADIAAIAAEGFYGGTVVALEGATAATTPSLSDFLAGTDPLAGPIPDPADDDALVLYTSGSSSKPKGVRLKHRHLVWNGFQIGERQGLVPGDRVMLTAPLFWAFGGANALPAAWSHGAALVLMDRFEAAGALDLIEQHQCTSIYTLPATTGSLLRSPAFDRSRTRSLRTGVTIGTAEDFMIAVERLGVPELCNIYGATETCGNCAVTPHDWPLDKRRACQGPPLDGQEIRIRDAESGALLPQGGVGLVEVRGSTSPGYTGASAALNATVFTEDGFYKTGDVGRINEDGAFVFVGRDTEMIKRQGINVSPSEIEDVMMRFAGVAECAVTGVPDPDKGELIVALVVADGGALDLEALADHCRTQLSRYKLPDIVRLRGALPVTPTGKLSRKDVKAIGLGIAAQARETQP